MQPYSSEWYEPKKEQIAILYKEQGGRDGLTGEKFTPDDILHLRHIYYDKGNYQIDD